VTFAWATARSGARQHLLWIALALSLALNLCFVAGALWVRMQEPPPPMTPIERLQRIGAQLVLDPQQRQAFDQYSETMRSHMQQMREAVEPLMNNAWAELAKPGADAATVARLFDEAAQTRRGFQHELIPATLSFLATLSPEQRAEFVELFRPRPRGQRPQHSSP
jgi:uncharacterized membrane protein